MGTVVLLQQYGSTYLYPLIETEILNKYNKNNNNPLYLGNALPLAKVLSHTGSDLIFTTTQRCWHPPGFGPQLVISFHSSQSPWEILSTPVISTTTHVVMMPKSLFSAQCSHWRYRQEHIASCLLNNPPELIIGNSYSTHANWYSSPNLLSV